MSMCPLLAPSKMLRMYAQHSASGESPSVRPNVNDAIVPVVGMSVVVAVFGSQY